MQLQVSGSNNNSGNEQGTGTACNESFYKLERSLRCLLSLSIKQNKTEKNQNSEICQTLISEGWKPE